MSLLLVANTINIAADIGAMGEALQPDRRADPRTSTRCCSAWWSSLLQMFMPYQRLAPVLKWLTLALFAYVRGAVSVHVPWVSRAGRDFCPACRTEPRLPDAAGGGARHDDQPVPVLLAGVAGSRGAARGRGRRSRCVDAPEQARRHLRRIKVDTWFGMTFSNGIAFCIMLTTAVTLHADGHHRHPDRRRRPPRRCGRSRANSRSRCSRRASSAPGCSPFPVLAGSAAYAVAESFRWPIGHGLKPVEAQGLLQHHRRWPTVLGVAIDFTPIDPIKALYWAAIVNGVIAVPIMAVMMRMAVRPEIMGTLTIRPRLQRLGWLATGFMAVAVVAMLVAVVLPQ